MGAGEDLAPRQLAHAGGPEAADVDGAVCDAVVDKPATGEEPAMAAPASFADGFVHAGKIAEEAQLFVDFILNACGKLVEEGACFGGP